MAARAMWKGIVTFGDVRVPVKLYAAIEDRTLRFRLLDRATKTPVVQSLVQSDTDSVVPYEATRRGFVTDEQEVVVLDPDELASLEPDGSRTIEVVRFVPPEAIDHRLYDRPYYLGPDGGAGPYAALARALARSEREGVARWAMRKKEYVGALRLHRGYPMLVTLRHAEEVVSLERVERPKGKPLDDAQLAMARQLVGMLEAPFEPTSYRDEYRGRVAELIEAKVRGQTPTAPKPRPRPKARDLDGALRASLRSAGDHRG